LRSLQPGGDPVRDADRAEALSRADGRAAPRAARARPGAGAARAAPAPAAGAGKAHGQGSQPALCRRGAVHRRSREAGPMSAPQRILAIDDDPSILTLVSHILERDGYEVAVAADGAEGLARIRSDVPDLVICDVQMPLMDGFATLESVRADASTATLPFVL